MISLSPSDLWRSGDRPISLDGHLVVRVEAWLTPGRCRGSRDKVACFVVACFAMRSSSSLVSRTNKDAREYNRDTADD